MTSDEREPQPVGPATVRDRLRVMLAVARSALDPRRWLIGGLAALMVAAGGVVLDNLSGSDQPTEWPWSIELGTLDGDRKVDSLLSAAGGQPIATAVRVAWNPELVGRPLRDVMRPAVRIVGAGESWSETAVNWSRFLVAVIVWSLAGVILVRMTAADVVRGESVSLAQAVGFGLRQSGSLLSASLISVSCFGVLWGLAVLGGLLAKIPSVGPLVVSLLWFIPLVLGLLMTIVALGFVVGWPLMVATIGVEDSDGFDGFTHAHGFLTDRPLLLASHAVIATIVASVAACLGWLALSLTIWFSGSAVSSGLDAFDSRSELQVVSNSLSEASLVGGGEVPARLVAADSGESADIPFSSTFLVFWIRAAHLLFVGYVGGVFWGVVTGLYLVVRDSADGIPMTQMWLESDDAPPESLGGDVISEPGEDQSVSSGELD